MIDKRVGPNFWLSEFLFSETAERKRIDNAPPMIALANLETITGPGLQRIRDVLGVPVNISSGYRSPALNREIGGSKTSAHMHGLAVDFTAAEYGSPLTIVRRLMEHANLIRADQIIQEGRWVHVAWAEAGTKPRGEVLTARFGADGSVAYSKGLG